MSFKRAFPAAWVRQNLPGIPFFIPSAAFLLSVPPSYRLFATLHAHRKFSLVWGRKWDPAWGPFTWMAIKRTFSSNWAILCDQWIEALCSLHPLHTHIFNTRVTSKVRWHQNNHSAHVIPTTAGVTAWHDCLPGGKGSEQTLKYSFTAPNYAQTVNFSSVNDKTLRQQQKFLPKISRYWLKN